MSEDELINRYSPILYFHTDERHYPSSVDWLLNYSTLVDHNANTKKEIPSQKDLFDIAKKYNFKFFNDGAVLLSFGP